MNSLDQALDDLIPTLRDEVGLDELGEGIYVDWARFAYEPRFVRSAMEEHHRFERTNITHPSRLRDRAIEQSERTEAKLARLLSCDSRNVFLTTSASHAMSLLYPLCTFQPTQSNSPSQNISLLIGDIAQIIGRKYVTVSGTEEEFLRAIMNEVSGRVEGSSSSSVCTPVSVFSGHKWLLGPKGIGGFCMSEASRQNLDVLAQEYLETLYTAIDSYHAQNGAAQVDFQYFPFRRGRHKEVHSVIDTVNFGAASCQNPFDTYYLLMHGRTTLPVVQYVGLEKAIDFIEDIGREIDSATDNPYKTALEAIERRIKRLTDGFVVPSGFHAHREEPGFILIETIAGLDEPATKQHYSSRLHAHLCDNNIANTVTQRFGCRLSIHYLNTEEELGRVSNVLEGFR